MLVAELKANPGVIVKHRKLSAHSNSKLKLTFTFKIIICFIHIYLFELGFEQRGQADVTSVSWERI